MKFKTQFIILLYTLFFLFYPGNSYYTNLFFNNRDLFEANATKADFVVEKVPYVINTYFIPDVSAESVYIADINSFTPLYEKNAHTQFFPASTTKIITALVAIDTYGLDDILTANRIISEGQTMGLVHGEKITFENLLYGLLVHSGNDAAYVIADNYPGGYEAFIAAMNAKAKSLHMTKSHFKNPAGLDDQRQVTSAYDLALAGRALLKNKELAKIVSTKSITISDVDYKYFHTLTNVNKLLGEIQGIGGLKTGYTLDAGENLVTFYKKEGRQFLIVILKSADRFADTTKIVNWINGNVDYINPEL